MAIIQDKYRKWVLAGCSAFLMVAFMLPGWFTGTRQHGSDYAEATVFGKDKVFASELARAEADVQLLTRTAVGERPPLSQISLAMQLFMGDPNQYQTYQDFLRARQYADVGVERLTKAPHLFALLRREALHLGLRASRDRVESIYRNTPTFASITDSRRLDDIRSAIESMVLIEALAQQSASAIKITKPEVQSALARQLQSMRISVITLDAGDYLAQIPAPSDEQLRELFSKFSNRLPGDLDYRGNPFGFSYLEGDRVQFDYIALPRAALLRAARLSRTDYDWEVEAQKYYVKNQKSFEKEVLPAPGSGPSTQPLAMVVKPFMEVRQQVLDRLIDTKADQLTQQVQKRIVGMMGADYRNYVDAVSKGGAAPATAFVAAYNTVDYLKGLAMKIESETTVKPSVMSYTDRYLDREQIGKSDLIGKSTIEGANGKPISFAEYVMKFGKPFFDKSGAAREPGAAVLDFYQPTPVFGDEGGGVYVGRVVDAKPSRVPQLAEVEAAVKRDVVTQVAQERAVAAAEKLSAEGQGMMLTGLAASKGLKSVTIPAMRPATELPLELGLGQVSQSALIVECFDLLRTDVSVVRPRAVVSLPRDRKVAIVELESSDQLAANIELARLELQAMQGLRSAVELDFLVGFFEKDAVLGRTQFKADASYRGTLGSRATTPAAAN